ncbi:MAG: TolC family protein [bacterium]|jgi:outer membrane protein TolC
MKLAAAILIVAAALAPSAANAASGDVVVVAAGGQAGATPSANPAAAPAEALSAESEGIPVVFTLDELILYGVRHNPEISRLKRSRDRQELARDANLFFTDPRLDLSLTASHRETAGRASTATQSGVSETEGMNFDISFTKPLASGDVFNISNSLYTTDVNVSGAEIPTSWGGSLSASYTWQLFKDRGKVATYLGFYTADNSLSLLSAQIEDETRALAGRIAAAYFNAAYLKEAVRVEEEALEYYELLLLRNVERYKVGLGLKSDILQAENAKISQESAVVQRRSELADAMRAIVDAIGYEEGAPLDVEPFNVLEFAPSELIGKDHWNRVLEASFALKQIESQLANLDISDAYLRNQLLPDFDLTARMSMQGEEEDFGGALDSITDAKSYSLTLTYSLPWGKRDIKSKLQQNSIQAAELAESRRSAVQALRTRYESLARALETTYEQVRLASSNVDVANENASILRERQRVGLATTLDVLDAENRLKQARLSYLAAVVQHLRSEYEFKVLAGLVP